MNKKYMIIAILILSLLMVACSKTENKQTSTQESSSKTSTGTTIETSENSTTNSTKEENRSSVSLNEMSLEEIISNLNEDLEMPMAENMIVEKDWYPNYVFVDYIDGSEALANEAMMSSVAHSAVILRLPEGSDVKKIRSEIEKNADPTKWVCVGAEKVEVVSNGNHILLVMSFEDITDAMVERFMKMK